MNDEKSRIILRGRKVIGGVAEGEALVDLVVRAGNRTLVVHRERTEEIKKLVEGLDPDLR